MSNSTSLDAPTRCTPLVPDIVFLLSQNRGKVCPDTERAVPCLERFVDREFGLVPCKENRRKTAQKVKIGQGLVVPDEVVIKPGGTSTGVFFDGYEDNCNRNIVKELGWRVEQGRQQSGLELCSDVRKGIVHNYGSSSGIISLGNTRNEGCYWCYQAQFRKRDLSKPIDSETCSWLDALGGYRVSSTSEKEWPSLPESRRESVINLEKGWQGTGKCGVEAQAAIDKIHWPSVNESVASGSPCFTDENCKVAGVGERRLWQPTKSLLHEESDNQEQGKLQLGIVGKGICLLKRHENLGGQEKGKRVNKRDEESETIEGRKGHHRQIPPILLMLNRDFIVASPLKQNLLLTLALTERKHPCEVPENGEFVRKRERERRQILVGHFTAFSSFLKFGLGQDATRVRVESNAGGTSTVSESLSVEYFVRRFQAKDIVTEMEVEYCAMNWKKVDYICTLYGKRVGVTVTRAMSFPDPKDFSSEMAYRLLFKKLFGLVVARHGVTKRHNFSQCILHVWCETQETANILEQQYEGVSEELDITDDVIMVLTVAEGSHARPIFYEFLLK